MSWIKQVFTDFQTVITSAFLNDLQDQIIADETAIEAKVDKETGKVLSANDFTNEYKEKLDGIAAGAEVNVNADWNASSGKQQILNKPVGIVIDRNYVHTDQNYTQAEKTKLAGISEGANNTVVDAVISEASSHPVESRAIYSALSSKIDASSIVSAVSSNSDNPVSSKAVANALAMKVDKVDGKGLSTNDFTDELKDKLNSISGDANRVDIDSALSNVSTNPVQNKVITTALNKKVDSVAGKGLSTNDFTTALLNKLNGIAAGAEVNVQSDWNAVSGDALIKNKPTNLVQDARYVHTDNNFTNAYKTQLDGLDSKLRNLTTVYNYAVSVGYTGTSNEFHNWLYTMMQDYEEITQYHDLYVVETTLYAQRGRVAGSTVFF